MEGVKCEFFFSYLVFVISPKTSGRASFLHPTNTTRLTQRRGYFYDELVSKDTEESYHSLEGAYELHE